MRVDAPGLVSAAQRLAAAVQMLSGGGGAMPHPPLAADPSSVGAAQRLSTASAQLTEGLSAHAAALIASLEHLTGAAISFTETDVANAAALTTLNSTQSGPAPLAGSASPSPPVAPDIRAPLPPGGSAMMPEALAAAVHTGAPGAEAAFAATWTTVGGAAQAAAEQLRQAIGQLPEVLDGPASTPAVQQHLLAFADSLATYADRGHTLARQAGTYADALAQARQSIPTPAQFVAAQNRINTLAQANAASGGAYAMPLAQAVNDKNQLGTRATTGHSSYHAEIEAQTAGTDSAEGEATASGGTSAGEDPFSSSDEPDPSTGLLPGDGELMSPEEAGQMSSMLPQMLPAVLGAVGGLMGAATKAPASLMQAGTQALGSATHGLSGLAQPKLGSPGSGLGDLPEMGGLGDGLGGGGGAPTTPAGGEGAPALGVSPSTGAPPTPTVTPVGATSSTPETAGAAGGRMGGMGGMGMPMGGMGGGAPGGGGGGKDDSGRQRKVVPKDVPHTEDITGRTDTNRLAAASATTREQTQTPGEPASGVPDSSKPVVRRLTSRPPKEPT